MMKTKSLKDFYPEIIRGVFVIFLLFSFLLFSFNLFFPMGALGKDSKPNPQSNLDIIMSQDVYFKVEGPVSGPPAPKLTKGDYPKLNLPSRRVKIFERIIFYEFRIIFLSLFPMY